MKMKGLYYSILKYYLFNFIRFYPSVAKKIAYDIVHNELHDQEYDEEDAKNWSLVLSDKIRDALRSNLFNFKLFFFYIFSHHYLVI